MRNRRSDGDRVVWSRVLRSPRWHSWMIGPPERAELLVVLVVAGFAPLSRLLATRVEPLPRFVAVAGVGCLAASIARGPVPGSWWTPRARLVAAAVCVGVVGVVGAMPSFGVPQPSILARTIVGSWLAGGATLAWWILGTSRWPWIGEFDRRALPPVLLLSLYAGGVAGDQERLVYALLLSACSGVAAVMLANSGEPIARSQRWVFERARRAGVRSARLARRVGTAGPAPLRVVGAICLVWWMANVRFWFVGAVRSGEIGYRAWVDGFLGPQWFRTLFALVHVVALLVSALLAGALLCLYGRRAWSAMIAAAALSGFLAIIGVLVWRVAERLPERLPEVWRWVF